LYPFFVEYQNQEGVDAGALTTSMYRQFFEVVFRPEQTLFERAELGKHFLPLSSASAASLSVTDMQKREKKFESFGRTLLKAVIDERTVAVPLASAVYKYDHKKKEKKRSRKEEGGEETRNRENQNRGKLLGFFHSLIQRFSSAYLTLYYFRYILNIKPTFRDLEVYDPELFKQLQRLLALPNAEQCHLDFAGRREAL
jgi:hypothetical protein